MNRTLCLMLVTPALLVAGDLPSFQRHDIDSYQAGYQVAVADINADGRLDVIALSTESDRVDWYENPTWKRYPIARTARNIDLAPRDLDGKGRVGLALASGFYFSDGSRGGEIQWLEAVGKPTNEWRIHPIAVDPVVHRLRWGDLDGDGKPELVHAPIFGPGSKGPAASKPCHLWAFRPGPAPSTGQWQLWRIDETLTVLHGLHVSDVDNDGRDEVLTASFEGIHRFDWEGTGPAAQWVRTHITDGAPPVSTTPGAARGSSEVVPGGLPGNHLFYAAIEPWHGGLVVVYACAGPWQRQVLDDRLEEGHALVTADLDRDGRDEVVAGWRAGKGGLAIYRAEDASGKLWRRTQLDEGVAVEGAVAADLNGDGRLDLVVMAGRSNRLVWYEQR